MTNLEKQIELLRLVSTYLVEMGTAVPIVFMAIGTIVGLIKAITGEGPDLKTRIQILKDSLGETKQFLLGDIERMEIKLGLVPAGEVPESESDAPPDL